MLNYQQHVGRFAVRTLSLVRTAKRPGVTVASSAPRDGEGEMT